MTFFQRQVKSCELHSPVSLLQVFPTCEPSLTCKFLNKSSSAKPRTLWYGSLINVYQSCPPVKHPFLPSPRPYRSHTICPSSRVSHIPLSFHTHPYLLGCPPLTLWATGLQDSVHVTFSEKSHMNPWTSMALAIISA